MVMATNPFSSLPSRYGPYVASAFLLLTPKYGATPLSCRRNPLLQVGGGQSHRLCQRLPLQGGVEVCVADPQAEADEALHEYGVRLLPWSDLPRADAIVAAVSHREYAALGLDDIAQKLVPGGAFIDVKAAFNAAALTGAG